MKIVQSSYGWSKMIFPLLDCCSPTTNNCRPKTIETYSNNLELHIELKIANFAMRVVITELNEKYKTPPDIVVRKMTTNVTSFQQFSAAIVYAYCAAVGYVQDNRVRSILDPSVIKDIEARGWAIGM